MGCGNHRAAHSASADVTIAHIVKENEDDIRRLLAGVSELADVCEVVVFVLQSGRVIHLPGSGHAIAEKQRKHHRQ